MYIAWGTNVVVWARLWCFGAVCCDVVLCIVLWTRSVLWSDMKCVAYVCGACVLFGVYCVVLYVLQRGMVCHVVLFCSVLYCAVGCEDGAAAWWCSVLCCGMLCCVVLWWGMVWCSQSCCAILQYRFDTRRSPDIQKHTKLHHSFKIVFRMRWNVQDRFLCSYIIRHK